MLTRVAYFPRDGQFEIAGKCHGCSQYLVFRTYFLLSGMQSLGLWLLGETCDGMYPHGDGCAVYEVYRKLRVYGEQG